MGQVLAERIAGAGHRIADRRIVRDDFDALVRRFQIWIADASIDVIVTTGGNSIFALPGSTGA
jgi:molybdopterin adenylyltransferase